MFFAKFFVVELDIMDAYGVELEDSLDLRKRAERGDVAAQFQMGISYWFRNDTESKIEAVKWFRKAAEQGDSAAQFLLGVCYDNGKGVEQDKAEAVKWYRKAAANGNEDAKQALKIIGLE